MLVLGHVFHNTLLTDTRSILGTRRIFSLYLIGHHQLSIIVTMKHVAGKCCYDVKYDIENI